MTSKPTLTVLCGMPAAGKSTWAAAQPNAFVVSCDAVREGEDPVQVFNAAHARAAELLGAACPAVVFDACSLLPHARARLLHLGRDAGARCELVFFCTPMLLCATRNAGRAVPALVNWIDVRAQARAALRAVQRERWDAVSFIPARDANM